MSRYEQELGRCQCCGLMVPYLTLRMVAVELTVRHVGRLIMQDHHVVYRRECARCRDFETHDG